jgi:DNA-binding NtrC family response regulator
MKAPLRILVVDDEAIVRESLGGWFRQDGYSVHTVQSAAEALRACEPGLYDIALLDVKMPGMDGLELQSRLAAADPALTIVMMTAYASVETAVRAMKAGAYDYIVKPFDPDDLSMLVKRAAEQRSLRAENERLKHRLDTAGAPPPIVGTSPSIRRVQELIATVSATDATVLVSGESGTGKELVARAIHAGSSRRYGPLVVVNCGALPDGILESELFGHAAGAFTGARARHQGKFELADGGTIFLDEVGELSAHVQVELLRVIEDKAVTRLGARAPVKTDFRVVAATNRDLQQRVREGAFREDLYWRLNVFPLAIPPLRERPEDVRELADHFLARFCRAMSRKPMRLSDEAAAALGAYAWPGNVRELQNAIERAVVVTAGDVVEASALPLAVTSAPSPQRPRSLADVERAHLDATLRECGWNVSQAARVLDVDRATIYSMMKRWSLKRPEDDRAGPPAGLGR